LIAIARNFYGNVQIIDRDHQRQIKRIILPLSTDYLLSMQPLRVYGYSNIFTIKDKTHVYLLDLNKYEIYRLFESEFEKSTNNALVIQNILVDN
jgi:hypothetical protein